MIDIQEQLDKQAAERHQRTTDSILMIGELTNWRHLKNNSSKTKMLMGRYKTLAFVQRGINIQKSKISLAKS